uniref:Thioredoxin n=1 Tax=Mimivirus LCMiAC01 TaxID=2506608 RepID=A0A481Z1P2_9VIRU|nr:MAG: thioredoxin [Mimivirus LCMiAC01]
MQEITSSQQYDDILKNTHEHNKKFVFIDFYATWCGPCKTIAPSIHEWSKQYNKNTLYCQIDVDNSKIFKIIKFFKIKCMPTFVIFDRTDPFSYEKIEGAKSSAIENMMKEYNNIIVSPDISYMTSPSTDHQPVQQVRRIQLVNENDIDHGDNYPY